MRATPSPLITALACRCPLISKYAVGTPGRSLRIACQSVPRQVFNGDHFEFVHLAKLHKVRHSCHGAIVVENLADNARGVQFCEARKINRRLRMASAL